MNFASDSLGIGNNKYMITKTKSGRFGRMMKVSSQCLLIKIVKLEVY